MASQNIVRLDKVFSADIWIDSPEWCTWLTQCASFRYEGKSTSFNCTKRQNGKWYATKKVFSSNGSKAVSLYVGADCTLEKLQEVEYHFSLDWKDFWHWYYSDERKQAKSKVVQPTACTTNSNDVTALKAEVEQLRSELERVTADRDRQLVRIAEIQNRMLGEIKKAYDDANKKNVQLEEYNREIDRANGYLERENQRLRTENDRLKAQLAEKDSLNSSQSMLEQVDRAEPTHPWTVGDTLKSRSWLRTQFRLSDRKSREAEIKGTDGSLWRQMSDKQSAEFAKRLGEKPNTVFYKCVA